MGADARADYYEKEDIDEQMCPDEHTPMLQDRRRKVAHETGGHGSRSGSLFRHPSRRPLQRRQSSGDLFVRVRGANSVPAHRARAKRSSTTEQGTPSARRRLMDESVDDLAASTESLGSRRGRSRDRVSIPWPVSANAEGAVGDARIAWIKGRNGVSPGITRRGAGMVLLGAWVFFSVGPHLGAVPRADISAVVQTPAVLGTVRVAPSQVTVSKPSDAVGNITHARSSTLWYSEPVKLPPFRRKPRHLPLSRQIGRISAWICTVLYMTSRLPQIWTNYKRHSVEGLSLFLFVAAFTANLLYVVNILASPKAVGPHAADYLRESVPFLLGSGGTLIFDLIIVVQWWMWHQCAPPKLVSAYGAVGEA